MNNSRCAFMCTIGLMLLTLTMGCAPSPTPTPLPTATQPQPTVTPLPPPTQTPVANTTAPQLVGIWAYTQGQQRREINLLASGVFAFKVNDVLSSDGVYVVSGDQISFTDNHTPERDKRDRCYASDDPGIYKWVLEDKTLTFTLVNDTCAGRKVTIADRWTRQ